MNLAVVLAAVFAVPVLAVAAPAAAQPGGPPAAGSRPAVSAAAADLAANVNPFSGTQPGGPDFGTGGGAENTFPGADVPFGMVQWSPDTAVDQPGGYYYPDNRIRGFSMTHFSGAGCDAAEDLPFMPFVGAVTTSPASDPTRYWSTFSHTREAAAPGYYGVTLDNGATTELTATQRSGMARITYPITNQATLLVNVSGSINGVLDAQVDVGKNTISGWATSGRFCGAGNVYRIYFSATFDRNFASVGTWHNDAVSGGSTTVRSGVVPSRASGTSKATTAATPRSTATPRAPPSPAAPPTAAGCRPRAGPLRS